MNKLFFGIAGLLLSNYALAFGAIPPPTPIPEPGTWALFALGAVGMFVVKKVRG